LHAIHLAQTPNINLPQWKLIFSIVASFSRCESQPLGNVPIAFNL
jgi:hypothetical protein